LFKRTRANLLMFLVADLADHYFTAAVYLRLNELILLRCVLRNSLLGCRKEREVSIAARSQDAPNDLLLRASQKVTDSIHRLPR
jgi:hypothetical protein